MILNIPYCQQKSDSACCGPCCIKMLADYYGITKPNGQEYSKLSLVKLCNTTKEYGTQFRDMSKTLTKLGLKRTKVRNLKEIKTSILGRKEPILTIIPDIKESGAYHYIILKGVKLSKNPFNTRIVVQDPFWGEHSVLLWYIMHLIEEGGNWMWAIRKKEI